METNMETNGKQTNADADKVFEIEDGLGGVTVTFFDHHGMPGEEQRAGSVTFPNYEHACGVGEFFSSAREMARVILNLKLALDAAGLMPCGSCFAFNREDEAPPSECPMDDSDQDPYLPIWLAYGDLVGSRVFDEHGIIVTPRLHLFMPGPAARADGEEDN